MNNAINLYFILPCVLEILRFALYDKADRIRMTRQKETHIIQYATELLKNQSTLYLNILFKTCTNAYKFVPLQKVLEIHMNEVIKIKKDSPLAKLLSKIIADKKVINEHIAKGGHLSDLKGKIGLNNAI